MRRRTPIAVIVLLTAAVSIAAPTTAGARIAAGPDSEIVPANPPPGPPKFAPYEHKYLKLRAKVVDKFGWRKPGRNIVEDGVDQGRYIVEASRQRVEESTATFDRWLHPQAFLTPSVGGTETGTLVGDSVAPDVAPGLLGTIAGCESGGNPTALNSSGAGGTYQIIPSTWAANGGTQYAPTAEQASPADQTRVAEAMFAASGTSPWEASRACWGG